MEALGLEEAVLYDLLGSDIDRFGEKFETKN